MKQSIVFDAPNSLLRRPLAWLLLLLGAWVLWWLQLPAEPAFLAAPPKAGIFPWSRTPVVLQNPAAGESPVAAEIPVGVSVKASGAAVENTRYAAAMTEPVLRRDDPTAALAGVLPRPVALDRRSRDRSRGAVGATAAEAPPALETASEDGQGLVRYRDPRGREGSAQLSHAQVSESDLGMAFYPGAHLQPGDSRRVQDPVAGESVVASLVSADPVAAVAAFYQGRWARLGAGVATHEEGGADGQPVSLSAAWPDGRLLQVSVLADEQGTRVVLLRTRPAAPAGR